MRRCRRLPGMPARGRRAPTSVWLRPVRDRYLTREQLVEHVHHTGASDSSRACRVRLTASCTPPPDWSAAAGGAPPESLRHLAMGRVTADAWNRIGALPQAP